jgi:hypothetical protein
VNSWNPGLEAKRETQCVSFPRDVARAPFELSAQLEQVVGAHVRAVERDEELEPRRAQRRRHAVTPPGEILPLPVFALPFLRVKIQGRGR